MIQIHFFKIRAAAMLVAVFFVVGFAVVNALPYGTGTYGTCTFSTCSISLSTTGSVNLNASPTNDGIYTIQNDVVNITSGASTGYSLSVESATASTNLINGSDTISTTSGTFISPQFLDMNSWGYRVDNVGGFGSGPTTAVTNAASSSATFAGLPANGTPDVFMSKASASGVGGDNYNVWYGLHVDRTPSNGTYTQSVLYTVTQNL